MEDNKVLVWDSRQEIMKEVVGRMSLILGSNKLDLKNWHETLSDYFDLVYMFLDSKETKNKFLKDIEEIDHLVNATGYRNEEGMMRVYTDNQRKERAEAAYHKMKKFLRDINENLQDKAGFFIQKNKQRNPNEAALER